MNCNYGYPGQSGYCTVPYQQVYYVYQPNTLAYTNSVPMSYFVQPPEPQPPPPASSRPPPPASPTAAPDPDWVPAIDLARRQFKPGTQRLDMLCREELPDEVRW